MAFGKSLIGLLGNKRSLWCLIPAAIAAQVIAKYSVAHWGLVLLDGISDPAVARDLVTGMTPAQVTGHLWFTTTIDVILPLLAGGLFVSAALLAFGKYGFYLALPPLVAVPLDLTEGVVQVLALTDGLDLLDVKVLTTPVKGLGYLTGLIISLLALAKWLVVTVKSKIASRS